MLYVAYCHIFSMYIGHIISLFLSCVLNIIMLYAVYSSDLLYVYMCISQSCIFEVYMYDIKHTSERGHETAPLYRE